MGFDSRSSDIHELHSTDKLSINSVVKGMPYPLHYHKETIYNAINWGIIITVVFISLCQWLLQIMKSNHKIGMVFSIGMFWPERTMKSHPIFSRVIIQWVETWAMSSSSDTSAHSVLASLTNQKVVCRSILFLVSTMCIPACTIDFIHVNWTHIMAAYWNIFWFSKVPCFNRYI